MIFTCFNLINLIYLILKYNILNYFKFKNWIKKYF